jgi:hypothetical protein
MKQLFSVDAYSKSGRRIIATVVGHVKSAKHDFVMAEQLGGVIPHIVIVDYNDAQMHEQMAKARALNPSLEVIYLVTAEGQFRGGGAAV